MVADIPATVGDTAGGIMETTAGTGTMEITVATATTGGTGTMGVTGITVVIGIMVATVATATTITTAFTSPGTGEVTTGDPPTGTEATTTTRIRRPPVSPTGILLTSTELTF